MLQIDTELQELSTTTQPKHSDHEQVGAVDTVEIPHPTERLSF